MSQPTYPTTNEPSMPEQFKPALPFSHVLLDTKEHILIHKIGNKHWAALDEDQTMVPIAEQDFIVQPTTHNLSFYIYNESGLIAVPPLKDMIRQMYEYNWTNGLAIQGSDVWNWDILKQEWVLNGITSKMAIFTRGGKLLIQSPHRQGLSTKAKL